VISLLKSCSRTSHAVLDKRSCSFDPVLNHFGWHLRTSAGFCSSTCVSMASRFGFCACIAFTCRIKYSSVSLQICCCHFDVESHIALASVEEKLAISEFVCCLRVFLLDWGRLYLGIVSMDQSPLRI
jgi:hypothetical protein